MRIGFGYHLFGGNRIPKEVAAQLKDIPRTKIEWLAEPLALLPIVLFAVVLLQSYGALPKIIPTHFGFNGAANGWGGKGTLIFLLGLNIMLYVMMTLAERFPALMNFPVAITAENARKQFLLVRWLMLALKVLISWMFCYIGYQSVAVAQGLAPGLGWAVWLFFMALIGLLAGVFILSYKWR